MPKYREETQNEHKELIRQALAMQPRASAHKIREMISASGIVLDPDYITRLKRKILAERGFRFNQAEVNVRIAEIQDKVATAQQHMWKILLNPKTKDKDKIAAAKGIVESEVKLFQSEMDAGIFERKLGELELRHGIALDPQSKHLILNAMVNFGVLKKPVIHEQIETAKSDK